MIWLLGHFGSSTRSGMKFKSFLLGSHPQYLVLIQMAGWSRRLAQFSGSFPSGWSSGTDLSPPPVPCPPLEGASGTRARWVVARRVLAAWVVRRASEAAISSPVAHPFFLTPSHPTRRGGKAVLGIALAGDLLVFRPCLLPGGSPSLPPLGCDLTSLPDGGGWCSLSTGLI